MVHISWFCLNKHVFVISFVSHLASFHIQPPWSNQLKQ